MSKHFTKQSSIILIIALMMGICFPAGISFAEGPMEDDIVLPQPNGIYEDTYTDCETPNPQHDEIVLPWTIDSAEDGSGEQNTPNPQFSPIDPESDPFYYEPVSSEAESTPDPQLPPPVFDEDLFEDVSASTSEDSFSIGVESSEESTETPNPQHDEIILPPWNESEEDSRVQGYPDPQLDPVEFDENQFSNPSPWDPNPEQYINSVWDDEPSSEPEEEEPVQKKKKAKCKHPKADRSEVEDIYYSPYVNGSVSFSKHSCRIVVMTICDACGIEIGMDTENTTEKHTFENGKCKCGARRTDELINISPENQLIRSTVEYEGQSEVKEEITPHHFIDNGDYEYDHPHRRYLVCSDNCGATKYIDDTYYTLPSCSICNPPKNVSGSDNSSHNKNRMDYDDDEDDLDSESDSGCAGGNHRWGEPINTTGNTYKQVCGRCGATRDISPSKGELMGDIFESYRLSNVGNNLFEENALNASRKLSEAGFTGVCKTISSTSDTVGEIIDMIEGKGLSDLKTEEWEYIIAETLTNDLNGEWGTAGTGEILKTSSELMDLVSALGDLKTVSEKYGHGKDIQKIISDFCSGKLEKTLKTLQKSASGKTKNLIKNVISKVDNLKSKLPSIEKVGKAMEALPFVAGAVEAVGEGLEYLEKQEAYIQLALCYDESVSRIDSIKKAAGYTNNRELAQAADNVKILLNDQAEDMYAGSWRTAGKFVTDLAVNEMKAALNFGISKLAENGLPALAVISAAGTVADMGLRWNDAFQEAVDLQTLGLMNLDVRDSIQPLFKKDVDAGYSLSNVYNTLQIVGYERTRSFLEKYEEAAGLSINEFRYVETNPNASGAADRYDALFNRLDNKVNQIKQVQNMMNSLYLSDLNDN